MPAISRTWVLIAIGLLQLPLCGQQNVGSIKGTVRDPSGAIMPGVSAVVRDQATGVETKTTTNETGAYEFLGLGIGEYTLTVSAPGFKTTETPDIRLVAGSILTFDLKLTLGAVTERVTVSARAAPLDTSSTTMGTTVTSEQLRNLPLQLAGQPRSSLNFLATLSTVNYNPSGGLAAINSANLEGSSAYGQNNYAGYSIDGMNASSIQFVPNDQAPLLPDAVAEVRLASNFNAEQGWNNGVQIEVVSKSGTNQFHGSAFEYLQNDAMDSRNWFAGKVSPEKQNEFGFTLGGPIRKNKTFFFGSLDIFRFRTTPGGVVASVPTSAMRAGDFSALLRAQIGTDALGRPIYQGEIYDPTSTRSDGKGGFIRDPFMYNGQLNVIPPSQISPISAAFQQGYPLPNLAGTQSNWVGSKVPSPLNINTTSVKIDHEFNERHRLTFGLDANPTYDQTVGATAFGPSISATQFNSLYEYRPRLNYTWLARPNLVYTLALGFTYVGSSTNNGSQPSAKYGATAGLKGVFTPNTPVVNIDNTSGFGTDYYTYVNPQFTVPVISSSLTWIRGAHTVKFGGDYVQAVIGSSVNFDTAGVFSFTNRMTGLSNLPATGWGYASFLLGQVDNASLSTSSDLRFAGRGWALYAQDQWRVTQKLTLNYGFRWNAGQTPREEHDRFGAFSLSTPNPAAGGRLGALSFWGTGPGLNGLRYVVNPNYAMFDPRLGLAYAFDKNTVIRAYYGIVSKQVFADFNEGTTAPTYGTSATVTSSTLDNGLTPAFNWNNGFPLTPTVPNLDPSFLNGSSVQEIDPSNNKGDRVQSFGLNVERSLPWGLTARAEYLGKMAHGIIRRGGSIFPPINQIDPKYLSLGNLLLANINSPQAQAAGIPVPYPGFKGSVAQALRPFPQYTNIDQINNTGGYTEYNAGHFGLQKRFGGGLTFLFDYTVSKMLVAGPFQDGMQNTDKMLSTNNRPQVLAISYDYELPFGSGKRFASGAHGVLQQVVGGWEVVGIHNYFAGGTITVSTNASIPTQERVWPIRVPGVPIRTNVGCSNYDPGNSSRPYLNVNAFATAAPFTFGNTNTLSDVTSCGFASENVAVMKGIRVSEKMRLKFSGNFFNLLNRHYWTGLGTNINNPVRFGAYNGATAPRIIQLSARVEF